LQAWYARHLQLPMEQWGGAVFKWREHEDPKREGYTVWSAFEKDSDYFEPSKNPS
jgi:lactoylglutathione lyase